MYRLFAVLMLLGMALLLWSPMQPVAAQGNTNPCQSGQGIAIQYGETKEGRINSTNGFVAYCFEGSSGDRITIDFIATSGNLDPYLGLLDGSFENVLIENDDVTDGNLNSQITFTLPSTGAYVIVGMHYDPEATFAGTYTISLSKSGGGTSGSFGNATGNLGNRASPTPTLLPEDEVVLTITCDTGETITGGVQFGFLNIVPNYSYTVTVFGLDDFDPVVAVETSPGIGQCNDDTPAAAGSEIAVPGTGNIVANRTSAQVRFTMRDYGNPVITVGATDGQSGTFVMVLEGLAISPFTELDGFVIRVASRVAADPLSVYMVSMYTNLDPYLEMYAGDGLLHAYGEDDNLQPDLMDLDDIELVFTCDDAGGAGCEDTPAFPGGGVDIANGSRYVAGEYDSGLSIIPNNSDPLLFVFSSYSGQSGGQYAIMVIGSVPGAR